MDEKGKVREGRENFCFIEEDGQSMFLCLNLKVKGPLKKYSEDGIFLNDSWSVTFLSKNSKVYSKSKIYPRQLLIKSLHS